MSRENVIHINHLKIGYSNKSVTNVLFDDIGIIAHTPSPSCKLLIEVIVG